VNPTVFKIIDGKLYLNYNKKAAAEFEADATENINKANKSWDKLTKK